MSWWALIRAEFKAIFTNPAVLMIIFGGCLFYSFLYPQPYLNQLPREQRIAVVNLDQTPISRHLERMVDATPDVKIVKRAFSIQQAKDDFYNGDISGFMVIPYNFYRDLMLKRSPVISYAGDASYFLIYSAIAQGTSSAVATLGASINVQRMLIDGTPLSIAKQNYTEIKLNARPVFNPAIGYINYVVPAVFIIILHQTLLIAVGILGGTQYSQTQHGEDGYWLHVPVWQFIFARLFAFVCIYTPLMMYFLGVCFRLYQVPHLASITHLASFALIFIIATTALGIVISALIPRRELATVIVLLSSLPLVFSAGFIWPVELLPHWINAIMQFIPSTTSIMGFVKLNQMGADMSQVLPNWLTLCQLGGLYIVFAYWLISRRRRLELG